MQNSKKKIGRKMADTEKENILKKIELGSEIKKAEKKHLVRD